MRFLKHSLELTTDEDSANLIKMPHASCVERTLALQKALDASIAALESIQATAGLDMMVQQSNCRREREPLPRARNF
jgi:hypothetical protein